MTETDPITETEKMTETDPKPDKEIRSKQVKIRLSESEYLALLERSRGSSLATWVRDFSLGAPIKKQLAPAKRADPKLILALNKIGNNLNQIARAANSNYSNSDAILNELKVIQKMLDFLSTEHMKNDR